MNLTSSKELEWEHVLALVRRYVATSAGDAELQKIAPSIDRAEIELALAEAGEGMAYLRAAGSPQAAGQGAAIRVNLNGLPNVTVSVQKLHIEGAALEPKEIFDLIGFLDRTADAKSFLTAAAARFPLLAARANRIGDFRDLLRSIEGKIQADGTVMDSASPHLNRLRREIEKQKKGIQDSLERFLRANRNEGVLQEEYITIRNDRFVVPVIAGQRRRLPGVVHGASNTGQTLFLEPMETIDLNNELVRLHEEEMREVFRILRELSERLRGYAEPIREAAGVMAALDLIFAKARFGTDFDCCIPVFGERLQLRNARHPLLMDVLRRNKGSVVPFSLTLDRECRTLLISGPNTGGKTVTLKTIGVIALMAQAGLPVPCAAAELPLFEQILADIGDHQSIEQNLSTFSAHVSRLREMALDVTPDSLVLLDEIGSATDPEEGGALGVALVDHFRAAGAFTLASTHLTALKIYGANTKTVLNASMGFDEETLAPTYQLQVGLPGKSAGLDIAARLGMPEDILRRARASLSTQEIELSQLIADLHKRLEAAEQQREALERERLEMGARGRREALEAERQLTAKLRDLEARFEELQRRWQDRADEAVAKIAETAERRKSVDQAQRQTAKVSREMREDWETSVLPAQAPADAPRKLRIEEGVRVRVKGLRDLARVRRVLGNDRLEVEAGFIKLQIAASDVVEVFAEAGGLSSPKLGKNITFRGGPELSPSVQELNIIGERADEAMDHLERFLDSAVMATAARVRIVHGHGMGVLKRAVQDLLKKSPHVEKYYPASQFEGGAGATIVELKE
ncbi:MAG: mismatch repair protein MutS2 [Bryobacterales bacterium]|nr:mismatch repair protein MutS2 [Bryobacterales bacterium]